MSPNTSSVMKLSVPIPNKSFCSSSSALLRFHESSMSHMFSVKFMSAVFSRQIRFKLWHTDLWQLRFPRLMLHGTGSWRSSDPHIPLSCPRVSSYSVIPTLYSYTSHKCCGESSAHAFRASSRCAHLIRLRIQRAAPLRSVSLRLDRSPHIIKGGWLVVTSAQTYLLPCKSPKGGKLPLTARWAPDGRFLCGCFKTHFIKMRSKHVRRPMIASFWIDFSNFSLSYKSVSMSSLLFSAVL